MSTILNLITFSNMKVSIVARNYGDVEEYPLAMILHHADQQAALENVENLNAGDNEALASESLYFGNKNYPAIKFHPSEVGCFGRLHDLIEEQRRLFPDDGEYLSRIYIANDLALNTPHRLDDFDLVDL